MGGVGTVFALTAIPFLLSGSLITAISMVAFAALLIVIAHDIYQMAKHQQNPMNELGFREYWEELKKGLKELQMVLLKALRILEWKTD